MDENQNGAPKSGGNPLIWGVLFVIVVLGLGWYLMQGSGAPVIVEEDASAEVDSATAAFAVQGEGDEVADIEADLEATDLGSLEEIDQI